MFTFKTAALDNMDAVYDIYQRAITHMEKNGIFQWDELYPDKEQIKQDIIRNEMVVLLKDHTIFAAATVNEEQESEYLTGNWRYLSRKTAVIHRLCVDPDYQNKGIGKIILNDIEEMLIKKGYQSVRLDAFTQNPYALRLYENMGFTKAGKVNYRKGEFVLFEKGLGRWPDDKMDIIKYYDALIEENNDPVQDPPALQAYMDKWDGQEFINELRMTKDRTVLEIGVGTGRLALKVCGLCKHFTGIDISSKTVERAKTNFQNSFKNLRNIDNAALVCGDFLTYTFNEKFDVIYSSLTFIHIKHKQAAINRAASLLNPGGRFVLSIDKSQQTEIDYGSRKITVYPDTAEEITALITEAGLNIEKQFETEFAVIFAARKGC